MWQKLQNSEGSTESPEFLPALGPTYFQEEVCHYNFKVIGRAQRAPHWGVQSRFRVIYICRYVGMSRMSN